MTSATATTQLDPERPWPGLESFEENARAFFFGRARETASLLGHVVGDPVTVLYGMSGLGKTSLLRAGLFPLLRDPPLPRDPRFLPVYVRFELKPGAKPLAGQLRQFVCDAVRAEASDSMLPVDDESLWEYLHRADFELWNAQNYPLTPVIVLDQFEELFTLGTRVPDLVREFRNDLGDLAENRIPADLAARIDDDEAVAARFDLRSRNYKILISLREDFLPDLEGWCRRIPALGRSRMRLLPLRAGDALDAVRKPAEHLMMTDALAGQVVRIVAGEDLRRGRDTAGADADRRGDEFGALEVEPALLSLFCRELNEARIERHQDHFDEQLIKAAKSGVLPNFYLSCLRGLPERGVLFIEEQLITENGFRNSYAREDAVPKYLTPDQLDRLIDLRLLRLEEHYGAQRIELTHDVLTRIVGEHRDRRRAEDEKQKLAAQADQERHVLEQAGAQREAELNRERSVARRFRRLSTVLALVCVVAVFLAGYAFWANNRAENRLREAIAERLSARGQLMLLSDQPGSELEAIDKILAAQTISDKPGIGALLTALNETPRLQQVIELPWKGVLSADGHRVGAFTEMGIQMLDTQTAKPIGKAFADPTSQSLAVSWDGRYVAVTNADTVIRVWDSVSGVPIGQAMTGSTGMPKKLVVSPDGHRVAATYSTANETTVRLWDAQTGVQIDGPLTRYHDPVVALAFSSDGRSLATGSSWDGTVKLWDATNGAWLRDMSPSGAAAAGDDYWVNSLAFSLDGHTIAAGGYDTLRLWNADTGAPLWNRAVGKRGGIRVAFSSSDGSRIVTADTDREVRVWDAATGEPIGVPLKFREPVWHVALTGDRIISISGQTPLSAQTLQISDATPDVTLAAELGGSKAAHLGAGGDDWFWLEADGSRINVLRDNTLRLLDPDTGEQIGRPVVWDALLGASSIALSHDKHWLALSGPNADIRIVDASNGQLHGKPMNGHTGNVGELEFSPDDKMLVSTSNDTVLLWDWRNGSLIAGPAKGHTRSLDFIDFSEDGQRLISMSMDSVHIWDLALHSIGKPITGFGITTFAVSRDGRRVAVVDSGEIREYDVESGEELGEPLSGHSKNVSDSEYSSDGRYLVSVGWDAVMRFWDTRSRMQIGVPVPITAVGPGDVDVVVSRDDRRVFVSSTSGIWEIPGPAAWADLLCAKLTSNPTKEQWDRWISPDVDYKELCPGKPGPS